MWWVFTFHTTLHFYLTTVPLRKKYSSFLLLHVFKQGKSLWNTLTWLHLHLAKYKYNHISAWRGTFLQNAHFANMALNGRLLLNIFNLAVSPLQVSEELRRGRRGRRGRAGKQSVECRCPAIPPPILFSPSLSPVDIFGLLAMTAALWVARRRAL